jgi:hypothetical protein
MGLHSTLLGLLRFARNDVSTGSEFALMFPTPPHTLNLLVTDIKHLASSCFWKIAALFAKLQHLRAWDLPPMHHLEARESGAAASVTESKKTFRRR